MFSQYTDLVERHAEDDELARPSTEEIDDVTARTRAALEKIVSSMSLLSSLFLLPYLTLACSEDSSSPALSPSGLEQRAHVHQVHACPAGRGLQLGRQQPHHPHGGDA